MGDKTGIGWTNATWNPVVGCSLASPGCTNCYAMKQAGFLLDKPGSHYHGTTKKVKGKSVWTGKISRAPDHIMYQPLSWRKPRMIFVNSMGDLFHSGVEESIIDCCFAVMALCPQHTFQVLTKRPDRMRDYMEKRNAQGKHPAMDYAAILAASGQWSTPALDLRNAWPLLNVWLGVSAEDQKRWDERVPVLAETDAAVRFVSVEPQIEKIMPGFMYRAYDGMVITDIGISLDWVIIGGESGQGARPFHVEWADFMVQACYNANISVFVKQLGAKPFRNDAPLKLRHRKGEDMDEWPATLRVQEFPQGGLI